MIPYSTRVKVGIALLSLVILNSTLRQSFSTLFHSQNLSQTHYISQYERRLSAIISIRIFLNARRAGFLSADLFPCEGLHLVPKVFDVSFWNRIVK